jgi:WD repeat-containing protein 26
MLGSSDALIPSNGDSTAHSNGATTAARSGASGVTNGTHKTSLSTNGSSNGDKGAAARALLSSDYQNHNREEVTRILIQALSDMGYQDAAESVSRDSGCELESPTVAAFRTAVLSGSWMEAEQLLLGATLSEVPGGQGNGLVLAVGSDRNAMRFWLRQQKFLELLEQRDTTRALAVLRGELTPLYNDTSKLHFLSSLLMCQSAEDLKAKADWDGATGNSRRRLLSELSSKSASTNILTVTDPNKDAFRHLSCYPKVA